MDVNYNDFLSVFGHCAILKHIPRRKLWMSIAVISFQFLDSEGGKQLRVNAREVANTFCEIPLQVGIAKKARVR